MPSTLSALQKQSLPLDILLIDDGSIDATVDVAEKLGVDRIVRLPFHPVSYMEQTADDWKMAAAINHAFPSLNCDYMLQLGADTVLTPTYIQQLIERMKADPYLVIAGGEIEGEPCSKSHVRGSGRLYEAKFWKNFVQRFPEIIGWETYPLFKARSMGLKVRSFTEAKMKSQRSTKQFKSKYGIGMKVLGYFIPFALAKCLFYIFLAKKAGIKFTWSYLFSPATKVLEDKSVKKWLKLQQAKRMIKPSKIFRLMKNRLRKTE